MFVEGFYPFLTENFQNVPKIRLLDHTTISMISAGEIVEQPSNVVKELVENSIDSGASMIDIRLESGGKNLIEVKDNGCGIEEEDISLAFTKHATSKLPHGQCGLNEISHLGFRGEALSSIAAVSRVEMESIAAGRDIGFSVVYQMDKEPVIFPSKIKIGTSVRVKNLFHGIPARFNFLRNTKSENYFILDCVKKLSIANSDIGFSVTSDEKNILQLRPNQSLLSRLQDLNFANETNLEDVLIPLDVSHNYVKLRGYVGLPTSNKINASSALTFVNNRPVKNETINIAIRDAYKDFIPKTRFPILVLFLDIERSKVDMNVNPHKSDVRFLDKRLIYGVILNSILKAISSNVSQNALTHGNPPCGKKVVSYPQPVEQHSKENATQTLTGDQQVYWHSKKPQTQQIPMATSVTNSKQDHSGQHVATQDKFILSENLKNEINMQGFRLDHQQIAKTSIAGQHTNLVNNFLPEQHAPNEKPAKSSGIEVTQKTLYTKISGSDEALEHQPQSPPTIKHINEILDHQQIAETSITGQHTDLVNNFLPEQHAPNEKPAKPSGIEVTQETLINNSDEALEHQPQNSPTIKNINEIFQKPMVFSQFSHGCSADAPLGYSRCQLYGRYIVSQTDAEIVIVDQHAAHERITYELMKNAYRNKSLERQALIRPELVSIGDKNNLQDFLVSTQRYLEEFGFHAKIVGQSSLVVYEIPTIVGDLDVVELIKDIVDILSNDHEPDMLEDQVLEKIAKLACYNSIRSGRKLTMEEMNTILRQIESIPNATQCNHGRPVYVTLKKNSLDRLFERC